MDNKIETYSTLWSLVDLDQTDHKLKEIAVLFLNAMNDWPTQDQYKIADFDKELTLCPLALSIAPPSVRRVKHSVSTDIRIKLSL